jgi:hypothetical protein
MGLDPDALMSLRAYPDRHARGQPEADKEFLARFRDLENRILNADAEQPVIEK